jgi:hypothetical protein
MSSCTAYKPYLDRNVDSPAVIRSKMFPDEKYEIRLLTGQTMIMKVDSVQDERLVGNIFVRGSEKNTKLKNYMIPYDQIDSVKKGKISAGRTAIAIVLPVTLLIFAFSDMTFTMGETTLFGF